MKHRIFSIYRSIFLSALAVILLSVPLATQAAEATVPAAETAKAVAADAMVEKTPEVATTPVVEEKPMTDAEKAEARTAAENITTYAPEKAVGVAQPWQVYYQPAQSPTMHAIKGLHDMVFVIISLIVIFVMGLMAYVMIRFRKSANPKPQTFTHNATVEIIWTVIPILILVAIGIPSIRAHYKVYFNEAALTAPDLTIKVVGHQWYWSYEYPDHGIAFDSNIKSEKELVNGEPRLLAVDNPIVVPVNKVVRIQMTAADVIHAWALPAFGVKKDAIPGRLNETWFKAEKEGIYFGQCSELCGKSHGFMPIMVYVVSDEQYATWVKGAKLKYAANGLMQFAALN